MGLSIPKFLPHRRYLPEDLKENTPEPQTQTRSQSSSSSKKDPNFEVRSFEVAESEKDDADVLDNSDIAILQDKDGKRYPVKEFRNNAGRPWWKFFDEFEYRETKKEASRYRFFRWYPEGTSKEEKILLVKLDLLITLYACVGYLLKYLDQSNLVSSYVSNMKEDIGMKSNDLIHTQTLFNAGYAVFQIPCMFFLPRFPLNYAIAICEIGWALCTMFTSKIDTVAHLQVLRFFIGSFEAAFYPCIQYTLSSWYLPSEVNRRGAIFYSGQYLGVLTSGLLQARIFESLDGTNGMSGWRWMFLIDGIISLVIGVITLYALPGIPSACYSFFLTDDDIRLARDRMKRNGSDVSEPGKAIINKAKWKKAFSTWHLYILTPAWVFTWNNNSSSSGSFALWLKSLGTYSIPKINNLTSLPPALGLPYIFAVSLFADLTRKRFIAVIFALLMTFAANLPLAIWDISWSGKWFGFLSVYWAWAQASIMQQIISDLFRGDNELRAIVWMFAYTFGYISYVWINLLVWPTVDSPRFHTGYSTCAYFSLAGAFFIGIFYVLYKRDQTKDALKSGIFVYNTEEKPLEESLKSYEVEYL